MLRQVEKISHTVLLDDDIDLHYQLEMTFLNQFFCLLIAQAFLISLDNSRAYAEEYESQLGCVEYLSLNTQGGLSIESLLGDSKTIDFVFHGTRYQLSLTNRRKIILKKESIVSEKEIIVDRWFEGTAVVVLSYASNIYYLRKTSLGKLILNK